MSEDLDQIRTEIDRLDDALLELLGRRLELARRAAQFKWRTGMPVVQVARMRSILDDRCARASAAGIPEGVAAALWRAIFQEAHRWDMERRAAEGAAVTDSAPGAQPGYVADGVRGVLASRVLAADVAETRAWLETHIGAEVDRADASLTLRLGGAQLVLQPVLGDAGGAPQLALLCDSVGLMAQDLRERGAPIREDKTQPGRDGDAEGERRLVVDTHALLGFDLAFVEPVWNPPD